MRMPAFLIVSLLLPAAAFAATPINEVRPLSPSGRVDIENVKGRIQVRGWDRQEVRITGSLGKGVEALIVEGDRQHLEVRVKYPRNGGWGGNRSEPTTLELMVPLQATLEIESVSANVDVSGIASRELDIDSVSGTVTVVGAPRSINADSVSGEMRLTVNSGKVSAESVSGGIFLRGRMNGEIRAEAVSGDIDVHVNGERIRSLAANTVSGAILVDTALAVGGEIGLESVSGGLTVMAPTSLSARVQGESMSGRLRAPGATINKPKYGPGSSFEMRYGSGEGEISMETLSGNAELKLR